MGGPGTRDSHGPCGPGKNWGSTGRKPKPHRGRHPNYGGGSRRRGTVTSGANQGTVPPPLGPGMARATHCTPVRGERATTGPPQTLGGGRHARGEEIAHTHLPRHGPQGFTSQSAGSLPPLAGPDLASEAPSHLNSPPTGPRPTPPGHTSPPPEGRAGKGIGALLGRREYRAGGLAHADQGAVSLAPTPA